MATRYLLGDAEPSSNVGGRPPALKPEHIAVLHDIVTEPPPGQLQGTRRRVPPPLRDTCMRCNDSSCAACARHLTAQTSTHGECVASLGRQAIRLHGSAPTRGQSPYSTNLTDAKWDLVADLFERVPGQRGRPVHYGRRDLVNTCARMCSARAAPSDCYPRRFHLGRRSTRHFALGWYGCIRINAGPTS